MHGSFAGLRFAAVSLALCAVGACGGSGVGDPCTPENIPPGGFKSNENYVESSSVQCQTRVCIVNELEGFPSDQCERTQIPGCTDTNDIACFEKVNEDCRDHLDPIEPVYEKVYCTCRCDGPPGFDYCSCPDGFSCSEQDILSQGGNGIRGRYCVRNSSTSG